MDSGVGTSEVHVFAYIAVVLKVFSPPFKNSSSSCVWVKACFCKSEGEAI